MAPNNPKHNQPKQSHGYLFDWRSGEVGDTGGSRSVQANQQRQAAHTRGDERQDDSKAKQEKQTNRQNYVTLRERLWLKCSDTVLVYAMSCAREANSKQLQLTMAVRFGEALIRSYRAEGR